MTYAAREGSVATGEPFECFEFTTPAGTFRYTTAPSNQMVGGHVYTPLQVSRTASDITTVIDTIQTSDITIPIDTTLAQLYAGRNVPDFLTVRVIRAHYGDDLNTEFEVQWRGEAIRYEYADAALVIQTQSILQAKVQGASNTPFYQLSCNHRVYDDRCQLDEVDFTEVAQITAVDNILITVDVLGHPASELPIGKLVIPRTGEERTIYEVNGKVVTITYPFVDVLVGDTVNIVLGCDNRMETCVARFDNILHFGGHRYVPLTNPFEDQ